MAAAPQSLKGRIALVTGGGRGIGKAITHALAEAGAAVAVNYRRDEGAAFETVAEIEKAGGRAKAYRASVDTLEDVASMMKAIEADFGGLDILINNAGIASRGQNVADTDPAEMERVVRIHAFGPFYATKLALPLLRKSPVGGRVIMISSVAAQSNGANGSPYNMGKGAMEALAMTLAKEERRNGVRVNVVRPSLTVTEMGSRLARATSGVKDIHELDANSPYGRVSTPEDVASVVAYLVSAPDSYVNGQIISVDGGR
jgi:NAD(P)-dependent dehydrogenase (short-subunit alcohol dehydrogenase family)